MNGLITSEDIAGILDALGKPDAAATLRWAEPAPAEVIDERDELAAELEHAKQMVDNLEAQLCKRCATKWKAGQ